ncbi:MAG: lipopolysaccharide biosynthesis protein [Deltaproteobacteria bacterium]|nr:lipopolysaccharide biosynthesis protein [Deltaproteobacteria bacterium]
MRRDIGWNLVPVLLLGLVGLGLNFVIGAWWDASALGNFNLVTIAVFAFAVLGAGGLQYAVLRALASETAREGTDRTRAAAIVAGALVPGVALAATVTAAFLLLRGPIGRWQSPAVAEGMLWAAPGLFCFAVNKILLGVVNGLRRMRAFAVYTSVRYLLIAVGLGVARGADLDGDQLPVIWTFTEGGLLLVLAIELLSTVELRRAAGWGAWARRHVAFGVRGVAAMLAVEVSSKLDVWVLGLAVSSGQVGVYSLAAAINDGALQLAVALQNNVNPLLARDLAAGDRDGVRHLVGRTRRWFVPAFVAACAAGALLYPFAIPWLIGDDGYARGAWPFAIMISGAALASPYLPFTHVLLMAAQPGWHTVYVLGILAVNLGTALVLVPLWGLEGAAVATAASLVASAALVRLLARRRVGLRI